MKFRFSAVLNFALGMVLFGCIVTGLVSDARADLVISVQSVSANAGSSGNSIEVFLRNTGPSSVGVAGFSFGISTTSSNINFTGASINTIANPYIFGGDSLFGPAIETATGQSLEASDLDAVGSATLSAGSTFGLGRVSFDVASATAPGPYTVSLSLFPFTSLSDLNGNNVGFSAANGQITVNGSSAVPEPSGLLLIGTGAIGLLGSIRRKLRV